MQCVYVAGRYSASTVIEVLENIRKGRRSATELLLKGFAVFAPWLDSELFLQLREGETISLDTIQAHSMAWLAKADLVYVLKGWEGSRGTIAEIKRAEELGIRVEYQQ